MKQTSDRVSTIKKGALGTGALALAMAAVLAGIVHADPPAGHFAEPGDGTVRDNDTGLVWQVVAATSDADYANAASYCDTLTLAASTDWRLPTIAELQSIVDETRSDPATDTRLFPDGPSESFWSATIAADAPTSAWILVTQNGAVFKADLTQTHRVRCVR